MSVQAIAKGVTISPKKLKWIVQSVRGMRVTDALAILKFLPSPAAREVAKVVKSAAANAENNLMLNQDELRIVGIYADKGQVLKRIRPRPRGRSSRILKRSSRITVVVDEEAG